MKLLIFAPFFLSLFFTTTAVTAYQKCAAVSNFYTISYDGYNVSASYKFSMTQNQGKNFINVTDINVNIPGADILYTCVMVNKIEQTCFTHLPNSTIFSSENSTISLMTVFKESVMDEESVFIGGGIFDEGSFSDSMGKEYTVDRPCITYTDKNSPNYNATSCCTAFTTTLPESSINAPACKNFKSRSTVYDVSDNYKIIATSKVNYTYAPSTLFANVSFSGQDDWIVELAGNLDDDCSASNRGIGHCSFDGPSGGGDFKMIIRMESFSDDIGLPSFLIGRIIFRNNQTLMEDGIPFTKQNDCLYFSQSLTTNLVATSSFCCIDFS